VDTIKSIFLFLLLHLYLFPFLFPFDLLLDYKQSKTKMARGGLTKRADASAPAPAPASSKTASKPKSIPAPKSAIDTKKGASAVTVRHSNTKRGKRGVTPNAVSKLAKQGGCGFVSTNCVDYAKKDVEEKFLFELVKYMYLFRTGKTFTIKTFLQAMAAMGKNVLGFNADKPSDRCNLLPRSRERVN
jgi:hypothetical protein